MRMLIIPDIHGRKFWKKYSYKKNINKYDKVIFLGDYIDPYDFEGISELDAIHNFKEIIKFKKKYNDKVILLLGNHDIYYYLKKKGSSRYSYQHFKIIEKLFDSNRELFQLAYETKDCLFTHAGYLKGWANFCLENWDYVINPTADSINSILTCKETILDNYPLYNTILTMVSNERGGRFLYGSCIWADVHEHLYSFGENNSIGKYQIFGHTLQLNTDEYYLTFDESKITDGKPIIEDKFAMLDCRHPFEYNDEEENFNNRFKELKNE